MKKRQVLRHGVQLLAVILTVTGLLLNMEYIVSAITIATVFAGVFYCGWICPFGSLQELMAKVRKFIGIKAYKMPKVIQQYLQFSRYIILVVLTAWTADLAFSLISLDPKVAFDKMLTGNVMSVTLLMVMGSFLVISLWFERPFCNYFCMNGAKNGALSILRPLTMKRNSDTCINCKKCDKVCPMNIQISTVEQIRSGQCINCFKCVDHCPKAGVMSYGFVKYNKKEFLRVVLVLGAVLIAVVSMASLGLIEHDHAPAVSTEAVVVEAPRPLTTTGSSTAVETSIYNNGIYQGTASGFNGPMVVEVTIENDQILKVEVLRHVDDAKWFNRANNTLPSTIVESQSANVDIVSGATYSSKGIIEATKNALEQAKK